LVNKKSSQMLYGMAAFKPLRFRGSNCD